MTQCPYRVRDFDNVECNRTNCTMTAFEVLNGAALYHGELTISTERCVCTDTLIELCHCPDCDPSYHLDHCTQPDCLVCDRATLAEFEAAEFAHDNRYPDGVTETMRLQCGCHPDDCACERPLPCDERFTDWYGATCWSGNCMLVAHELALIEDARRA